MKLGPIRQRQDGLCSLITTPLLIYIFRFYVIRRTYFCCFKLTLSLLSSCRQIHIFCELCLVINQETCVTFLRYFSSYVFLYPLCFHLFPVFKEMTLSTCACVSVHSLTFYVVYRSLLSVRVCSYLSYVCNQLLVFCKNELFVFIKTIFLKPTQYSDRSDKLVFTKIIFVSFALTLTRNCYFTCAYKSV